MQESPTSPPCLLIITDIPERADRLINALTADRYQFRTILNLDTLIYPASEIIPDLAIVWFPFSSPEVLSEFENLILNIKNINPTTRIPILLIIDQVGNHWVDPAFKLGVTDILTRPIHPLVLRQRVNMLLAAQQTKQALADHGKAILELRAEEEKLRLIADFTYDWEYWMATDGSLVYNSPACKKITKIASDMFIQDPDLLQKIVHPDDMERVISHLLLEKTSNQPYQIEFRIITSDGQIKYIDHACQPVNGNDGRPMGRRVSNRDSTEKKSAEQALIRSERLAAMGRLLASLAHEINNPLQAITSCVDLLSDFDLSTEEAQDYLKSIKNEIDRLTRINRQILNFSRSPNSHMVDTSVHNVIDHAINLSRKQIDHQHIQMKIELPDDLPNVIASPDELGQVFLNLIINAIESMPDGGNLTISGIQKKDVVEISFCDTGKGIPADELEIIFEPFFSTKLQGTGLGLAISQKIITRFGGRITASSHQGTGTQIIVNLSRAFPDQETMNDASQG